MTRPPPILRLLAALVLGLAVSACSDLGDTPSYRYRLTIEVDTPQGLRTGSSVIEVQTATAGRFTPTPRSTQFIVRGEAVAVEVSQGQFLFALLRSPQDSGWAASLMFRLAPTNELGGREGWLKRYRDMLEMREPRELPKVFPGEGFNGGDRALPMLVTFGDLDDPTSVERVDPDDLAASFGEGYALRRIKVQVTDDPVTSGIENTLRWLPEYFDKMLDGQRLNTIHAQNRLANDLSRADFSKGILR